MTGTHTFVVSGEAREQARAVDGRTSAQAARVMAGAAWLRAEERRHGN